MLYYSRNQITNSAKGGDYYDEHLYLSDVICIACGMLNARFIWFFDAHPISGVFFVCLKHLWRTYSFMHPKGCFLFFVEGIPDISYNEKSMNAKGDFYNDRCFSIFEN